MKILAVLLFTLALLCVPQAQACNQVCAQQVIVPQAVFVQPVVAFQSFAVVQPVQAVTAFQVAVPVVQQVVVNRQVNVVQRVVVRRQPFLSLQIGR